MKNIKRISKNALSFSVDRTIYKNMDEFPITRPMIIDDLIACIHREYISDIRDMSVIRNACNLLCIEIEGSKTSDTELDTLFRASSILKEIFGICSSDVIILGNTFEMVCILIDTLTIRKMHLSLNNRDVYIYLCNILTSNDFRQKVRPLQIIHDIMLIRWDDKNMEEFMLVGGMKSLLTFSQSKYDNCCECCTANIHRNMLSLVCAAHHNYEDSNINTPANMHLFVLYAREQEYGLSDDLMRRINNIVIDYECVSQFSHLLVEIIRSPSYPRSSFHVNNMTFNLLQSFVDKSAFESAGGSRELIQNKLRMIREEYNCENITEYHYKIDPTHSIYRIRKCLWKLYNDDSDRHFCMGFESNLPNWDESDYDSDSDLDDSDSDDSDSDLHTGDVQNSMFRFEKTCPRPRKQIRLKRSKFARPLQIRGFGKYKTQIKSTIAEHK